MMTQRSHTLRLLGSAAIAASMLAPLTGCKSEYDRAVEKAKHDAVETGQAQQVVSVSNNGSTIVTVVQPPQVAGQPVIVNSVTEPTGAPMPSSLPDYSNGARPAPGNTVVFAGPRITAPHSQPGTAATVSPAPAVAEPSVGPAVTGAAPGADAPEAAPANFVPTEVTLPAGTGLAIRINQTLSVKHTQAGDRFSGSLAETVRRNGDVVLPRGTRFNGVVTEAHRRGHFKGHSYLGLRLTSMVYDGKIYPIETASNLRTKKGKGKRTAGFIGGGAGAGMLIGGLATGGVGLAVGALSGGGLGTLLAGITGNRDITIPAETLLRFRLEDPLTVQPAN